jgi:HSP20 family protein
MADITRFNPFRGLGRLEPFGREMEDMFKGFFLTPVPFNQISAGQIPVDVTEDEKSYKVRAEIPGFNKEEINVSVNGDQVSISAETKKEKEEKKGDQVVVRECYYGRQYRAFTLPQAVDDAGTTAKYENGVLELSLPKKAAAATKKIAID